ncbi:phytoene synthase [soil metagenome]
MALVHTTAEPMTPIDRTDELRQAFAAAKQMCREHARSFFFASFFLPQRKREAAYAVYAFCRMIDDAIDVPDEAPLVGAAVRRTHPAISLPQIEEQQAMGGCSLDQLETRLELLSDRLDEIYDDRLELPAVGSRSSQQHALVAFAHTAREYEISKQYFLDVASGCRMDLTIKRYADWPALENYCYHVAGVVGLIMSCIFGLQHSDAKKQAVMMGNAMQLTNILRDIKEDFDRGRIYLPQDEMKRFGYSESDLANGVVNESFRELMRFQIARARQLYQDGAAGLCWLAGDGSRLTASAMAVIYSGIFDAIESQRYDVFTSRAHLTTAQKIARVPRAWKLAKRLSTEPMPILFK